MTIDDLKADLTKLPVESLVPNTDPWFRHLSLSRRLSAARFAADSLAELNPKLAALEQQRSDLVEIREELTTELAACAAPETEQALRLRLSLSALDGQMHMGYDAFPVPFPLFDKLRARGYAGPSHASWNPMSALAGPLPYVEQQLAALSAQRTQAQSQLDRALREPADLHARG